MADYPRRVVVALLPPLKSFKFLDKYLAKTVRIRGGAITGKLYAIQSNNTSAIVIIVPNNPYDQMFSRLVDTLTAKLNYQLGIISRRSNIKLSASIQAYELQAYELQAYKLQIQSLMCPHNFEEMLLGPYTAIPAPPKVGINLYYDIYYNDNQNPYGFFGITVSDDRDKVTAHCNRNRKICDSDKDVLELLSRALP